MVAWWGMSNTPITTELRAFKDRFDPLLAAYMDARIEDAAARDPFTAEGLRYVRTLLLSGGKRLRPALALWGYQGCGGTDTDAMLQASLSVELVHTFLLIHDDIMDRDALRHGIPTLHEHYRVQLSPLLGPERAAHAGTSLAMVFGDMLDALGNHALFCAPFPPERIHAALRYLQETVSYTVIGQLKDVMMEYRGTADTADVLAMYEYKTARYTIESPLVLGAILAGTDAAQCDRIAAFARPLGVAFQIRDDLIGIYGDTATTGKPVGSDLREGKMTLLTVLGRAMAANDDRAALDALLGRQDLTDADVAMARDILERCGARAAAEAAMADQVTASVAALADTPFDTATRDRLAALGAYLTTRTV